MNMLFIALCLIASVNGYGFQIPTSNEPSPVETAQNPQNHGDTWNGGFHSLKPWTAPESGTPVNAPVDTQQVVPDSKNAPVATYFPTQTSVTAPSTTTTKPSANGQAGAYPNGAKQANHSQIKIETPTTQAPATASVFPPKWNLPVNGMNPHKIKATSYGSKTAPAKPNGKPASPNGGYLGSTQKQVEAGSLPLAAQTSSIAVSSHQPVSPPAPSQANNSYKNSKQTPAQTVAAAFAATPAAATPVGLPNGYKNPASESAIKGVNGHAQPVQQPLPSGSSYQTQKQTIVTESTVPAAPIVQNGAAHSYVKQTDKAKQNGTNVKSQSVHQSSSQQNGNDEAPTNGGGKASLSPPSPTTASGYKNSEIKSSTNGINGNVQPAQQPLAAASNTYQTNEEATTTESNIPEVTTESVMTDSYSNSESQHVANGNDNGAANKPPSDVRTRPALPQASESKYSTANHAAAKNNGVTTAGAYQAVSQGVSVPQSASSQKNSYQISNAPTTVAATVPTTAHANNYQVSNQAGVVNNQQASPTKYGGHQVLQQSKPATSYSAPLTQNGKPPALTQVAPQYFSPPVQDEQRLSVVESSTVVATEIPLLNQPSVIEHGSTQNSYEATTSQTFVDVTTEVFTTTQAFTTESNGHYTTEATTTEADSGVDRGQQTQFAGSQSYLPQPKPLSNNPVNLGGYQNQQSSLQVPEVSATVEVSVASQIDSQSVHEYSTSFQATEQATSPTESTPQYQQQTGSNGGSSYPSSSTGIGSSANGGVTTKPYPVQGEAMAAGSSNNNFQTTSQGSSSTNGDQSSSHQQSVVAIIDSHSILNEDGSFAYKFESEDGIKVEASGHQKQVGPDAEHVGTVSKGAYSYTAPDGVFISVQWVADEKGFQPVGDHIPSVPSTSAHGADNQNVNLNASAE